MKKFSALLAVVMLIAAMLPVSAMAYDTVTISETSFPHTLTLTEANLTKLPEETVIAYTYTVGSAQMMTGTKDNYSYSDAKGVTGAPVITGNNPDKTGSVIFNSDSVFTNGVAEETMTVNWSNVVVTDPGVYLWKVTKAVDTTLTTGTNNNHSNEDSEFYLYAIVLNNNSSSALLVSSVGISMVQDLSTKDGSVDDSYPVKKVSLELEKKVSGTMASANQYFPFEITLSTLPGTYSIEGVTTEIPKTAYNEATTNDTAITVNANGTGTVTLWLKHGDVVTIENLPYGSSYTIVENVTSDFTVSATVSGSDTDVKNTAETDYTVTDDSLTADASVSYLNTKNAPVATGVVLNTAAPVMGILLALSLLAVLYIGKRKKFEA